MQRHQLETFPHTFYFSITSGERNNFKQSRLELITEPSKISKRCVGFDLEITEHLKVHGSVDSYPSKPKSRLTLYEWVCSFLKTFTNPISVWDKLFLSAYTDFKPPVHLSNLFNPNMNNLMAIDYCN